MQKWQITYEDNVEEQLRKDFVSEHITKEDIQIIKQWAHFVEEFGPAALAENSFWNDHALDGNWRGHRSSSFGFKGRIIYKVIETKIFVNVVRITPEHNYKKGR